MNQLENRVSANRAFSNIQLIIGIFLIISSLYKIADNSYIRSSIMNIMFVLGLLTMIFSVKRKKICNMSLKYTGLLGESGKYNITDLALVVGITEDKVREEIQKLINKGYLQNGYLESSTNSLVLPERKYSAADRTDLQKSTIICNSCGGENEIPKGKVVECEYCGSRIKD
ncbi:hypothetical protein [Miniphocaeibacter massiliensis]|uniref:hypothetical protein n=1 Tax=Miniphocaeibacter massiliensis TaxID=2041841 RepID=UPI000C1C3FBF|nr:hypothetical protein [Miniphocaeibacter massiliensis]